MHTVPAALSEASLLLSILQESPSRLLGRMVFEVGVLPQRLQLLMASFHHMHMMEVLVKCCCPQLPACSTVTAPRGEERISLSLLCQHFITTPFFLPPCHFVLLHTSPDFFLTFSLSHFSPPPLTLSLLSSPLQHPLHTGLWWL